LIRVRTPSAHSICPAACWHNRMCKY